MRISDWSSDVCSSDLIGNLDLTRSGGREAGVVAAFPVAPGDQIMLVTDAGKLIRSPVDDIRIAGRTTRGVTLFRIDDSERRSEEHTSELQSLMRISYAVFCLKKNNKTIQKTKTT